MESRRQNVRLTVLRRNARSTTSTKQYWIPDDLLPDILSRLPAQSIARFRCVSKTWSSMIHDPHFSEMFLTRSCARPHLLFAFHNRHEVLISSSNQPQNLDRNLSPVPVNYHMRFAFEDVSSWFSHVNGLLCVKYHRVLKTSTQLVTVICNPSTGESFSLPKMKTRKRTMMYSFFGYDPIGKQFKVLAMTLEDNVSREHQVFTLGSGNMAWRMIECGKTHAPECGGICINGVLYYKAGVHSDLRNSMIVCFDVRTEKFSFIRLEEAFIGVAHPSATLVNFNGKLASLFVEGCYISGKSTSFVMWVLEDRQKHEWSKGVYNLPPRWQNVVGKAIFDFVGVAATNEVLLSPHYLSDPFYVYCYNLERRTIRRLQVQGLRAVRYSSRVYTYLNHVEDIKPLRAV